MSHHCRQCDGHVMPDDDGGYCSHTCHAEGLIAEADVDAIVRLLRIEVAAQSVDNSRGSAKHGDDIGTDLLAELRLALE
ncbi:hypothetical protein UFOVP141_17 [uncultured Caudovirales phage]|uniref:Uncharacterized protein n=1 Tax=uncultured Caudovirales phage TaxID=2100421 RepID=A0A6J7VT40_9CAUD|nr:hypothetical protein UFOVP141_17 [uncultured Caudovirales phage]